MNEYEMNAIISVTDEELEQVGDHLRAIRKEKKITQEKMVKDTGLSEITIRGIENGWHQPSYNTIVVICSYLGVQPNDFFPARLAGSMAYSMAYSFQEEKLLGLFSELNENNKSLFLTFATAFVAGLMVKKIPNRKMFDGFMKNRQNYILQNHEFGNYDEDVEKNTSK